MLLNGDLPATSRLCKGAPRGGTATIRNFRQWGLKFRVIFKKSVNSIFKVKATTPSCSRTINSYPKKKGRKQSNKKACWQSHNYSAQKKVRKPLKQEGNMLTRSSWSFPPSRMTRLSTTQNLSSSLAQSCPTHFVLWLIGAAAQNFRLGAQRFEKPRPVLRCAPSVRIHLKESASSCQTVLWQCWTDTTVYQRFSSCQLYTGGIFRTSSLSTDE